MPNSAKILLVEDNEDDTLIVKGFLKKENVVLDGMECVSTFEEAEDKLKAETYDLVFIDYHLGASYGLELLSLIDPERTVAVMLTGSKDFQVMLEADKRGAKFYFDKPLSKNHLETILKNIKGLSWTITKECI